MARLRDLERYKITRKPERFAVTRTIVAAIVSSTLLITPVCGSPSSSLGTIVYADHAHIGAAPVSVGATVFSGATFIQDDASPAATLVKGSATFSTANSKAFALRVASAIIRANSDQSTIGQVTVLNPKELIVKSTRGSLIIAVEDDVRVIPEGAAYRIVLDPTAAAPEPQGPRGAGTKDSGGPPHKAARNKFIWYPVAITALATVWAVHEAFESPDRP